MLKGRTRKRKQYERNMISCPFSILDVVFWISWMLFKWVLQHTYVSQSYLYFNWFVSSGFIDSTGTVFLWNSVNNFSVFLFEVYNLNTKNPQTKIKTSFTHIFLLKAQQAALLALIHKSQLYSLGQTKTETLEGLKVHRCGQGWKTLTLRLSCPDIWKNTKQVTWV